MKSLFYLTLFAAIVFFSGCQKSGNAPAVKTESEENALANAIIYKFGFENSNHDTSFKGWVSPNYSFSKDVPQGGGVWSLSMVPGWIPQQGYAEHYATLSSGTYQLKLSSYTKVLRNGIGYLRLFKQRKDGIRKTLAEKSFRNSSWQINAVMASVNIQAGDIIIIQLSAGATEVASWQTLFANVRLERQ